MSRRWLPGRRLRAQTAKRKHKTESKIKGFITILTIELEAVGGLQVNPASR